MPNYEHVKVGDLLLVVRGSWAQTENITKVERLTKTLIIADDGRKYKKFNGYIYGNGFGYIRRIASKEDVDNMVIRGKKITLLNNLKNLTHVNSEKLIENIDKIFETVNKLKSLTEKN